MIILKKEITLGKVILILCILFLLLSLFVWFPISYIDRNRCFEKLYDSNISRCDKINVVGTINPFKFSSKCYCENYDRIYFDMEEN